MSSNPPKLTKQETMMDSEEKNQFLEIEPETTQTTELVNKNIRSYCKYISQV